MNANYQKIYDEAIANGCTPTLADLLASRRSPGLNTDTRVFGGFNGVRDPLEDTPEEMKPMYRARAKAAGINTDNARYFGSMARFPGDPEGWAASRGEIRERYEKRGDGCTPALPSMPKVKVRDDVEPAKSQVVSEKLVLEHTAAHLDEQGVYKLPVKEFLDVKAKIRTKLSAGKA